MYIREYIQVNRGNILLYFVVAAAIVTIMFSEVVVATSATKEIKVPRNNSNWKY